MQEPHAAINRLLLVHRDDLLRSTLAGLADRAGLTVWTATCVDDAIQQLRRDGGAATVVVGASALSSGSARTACGDLLAALTVLRDAVPNAQIILVTDYELDLEASCEVVRLGVAAMIDARDGQIDESAFCRRIAEARHRFEESLAQSAEVHFARSISCDTLIWQSPAMAKVLAKAARAGQVSDLPVLVHGESGTGKQLLAELIHQLDPKRSSKRFLSVNCAAISGTLAESALFGHVRGAFTGATESRKGHFRAADGGTILLDEIGEMDAALQPKLLRVLQDKKVMPLGADDEVDVDVRIIAATNRRLAALVEEGSFRLDLYQRLNVISLDIPPLRERVEDIPALVRFFLSKYASYYERPITGVDDDVFEFLSACTLRGNVRELENTVRQMLAFKTGGDRLEMADVTASLRQQQQEVESAGSNGNVTALREMVDAACRLVDTGTMTLPDLVDACEKMVLRNKLQSAKSTSAELARQLGLSRRTLYNKIHKHRLPVPSEAGPARVLSNPSGPSN